MFLKVCRLLLTLILLHPGLIAQPAFKQGLRMRSLSVNEGLAQGAVSGIVQDKRGFIWIASEGLSRYNGRNLVHFRHVAGDSSSLTSNYISYMRLDDQDHLWLLYISGEVDVFNTVTTQVRHISAEKDYRWLNPTPKDNFFITQEGGRYLQANLTSLTLFDPERPGRYAIALPAGENLLAIGASNRDVTVVSTNKGLYEIRGTRLEKIADFPSPTNEAEKYLQRAVYFHSRCQGRILERPDGILIIPGMGYVYLYDPKIRQVKSIPLDGLDVPWGLVQANGAVYARSAGGLIRIDQQGAVTKLAISADILLTNELLMDHSGVLWAATSNALGLRLFDTRPVNFHSYTYASGFLHDALEPWLPVPMHGQVAFGSYAGRCTKDRHGNVWVDSYQYLDNFAKRPDWPTTMWPGSGVYRLAGNQAVKLPFKEPGWKISNITFDGRNQCWLTIMNAQATETNLVKADVETGAITPFVKLPRISTENSFLTAAGSHLCMLVENHLYLYDTATAACTILSKEQLGSNDLLLMALPDSMDNHLLWVATKGSGILRLNTGTRQVTHYTESNGLPNNTVYYMARDKRGFFWCSSNKGIFRFDPSTGATMSFLAKDGLQGNEFNRYHFMETPDGHFIFGGTEGYTRFHPDSVSTDPFQTPVTVSGILVNNQPLQKAVPGMKDSLAENLRQLVLSHNQNFLTVLFAGLQYNAPEELHYRYQLQGLEEGWTEAGPDASARYAYIPPGHYTFRVNASNTSGLWSSQVETLAITILPPWWKTAWAYALYLIAASGLGWALYRNWLSRAKDRQHIILQQKEAEQLKAVDEMKSRFFNNITHEFRTPLSLIIAPVEQMRLEYPEPRLGQKLGSVQRHAEQLLQLINQLLDMAKLEAGNMHLHLYRGNLPAFIQEIAGSFAVNAGLKQLTLNCHLAEDLTEHNFDADKLRKIMHNLLSNAIKFTPAGGYVTIRLKLERLDDMDQLEASVEDSGIGVEPAKLPHLFTRFYQVDDSRTRAHAGTGIGLALVKELTDLMGGTITASNNTPPKNGMLFVLTLPVERAAGSEAELPAATSSAVEPAESGVPAMHESNYHDHNAGRPLVLVAEDHQELRHFICSAFTTQYRVLSASNGKEGWELAQREFPDVIISDVMMPEGDGMEFCRRVKTTPDTSHIAFVLLTARSSQGSRVEGLESRADDYISKPFHLDELQMRVRNILARQHKLREFYNRQLTRAEEPLQQEHTTDPFLLQVYEEVEKHLDESGFTVDMLAASVAVSNRTLARKLNAIAGITPADLIRKYRLKKAAGLLRAGKPVSEVAWSVGFETSNYFSTAFKALYGVKPSEYGKAAGGKE